MEAYRRKRAHEPIVKTNHGPHTEFKFSLGENELVECADKKTGERRLFRVRSASASSNGRIEIELCGITDARQKHEQRKAHANLRESPNTLRNLSARKVRVTALGDVVEAHD